MSGEDRAPMPQPWSSGDRRRIQRAEITRSASHSKNGSNRLPAGKCNHFTHPRAAMRRKRQTGDKVPSSDIADSAESARRAPSALDTFTGHPVRCLERLRPRQSASLVDILDLCSWR